MTAKAGDRIAVEAKSTTKTERSGTVQRVLRESPPRYEVRWDDGRESVIAPAAGELRVVSAAPAKMKPAARKRATKSTAKKKS